MEVAVRYIQLLEPCRSGRSLSLFLLIALQVETSYLRCSIVLVSAFSPPVGLRGVENSLRGQRIWLHGLDALPNTSGWRPMPCGPELRSGYPLSAAPKAYAVGGPEGLDLILRNAVDLETR